MALISGAHMIVYSANGDADRAFLRDVVGLPHVDVGHGWLIFALPASEIAVHPAETSGHGIYLMVDDVEAFVAQMADRGVRCTAPHDQGWGVLTELSLPGGGQLGVYQPRHARPTWSAPRKRKAAKRRKPQAVRRVAKKAAKPARRGQRRAKR
jgi:hypothetical protein